MTTLSVGLPVVCELARQQKKGFLACLQGASCVVAGAPLLESHQAVECHVLSADHRIAPGACAVALHRAPRASRCMPSWASPS